MNSNLEDASYQGLPTLEVLQEATNYNAWIAETFLPHTPAPLLEIGSGIGNLSPHFLSRRPLYLSDNDAGLLDHLRDRFADIPDVHVVKLDIQAAGCTSEFDSFFSSIVAINVLEHLEDDQAALASIRSMLRKDGRFALLVPAKRFAYTHLDRALGHFRRYEPPEVRAKLYRAGFILETMYFFNIVGLLSWVVRDKLERGRHLRPYQVSLFDRIVPLLRRIEGTVKPPLGVSIVALARKALA